MIDWHDLFVALALVLVIEGILPFINPATFRNAMAIAAQMSDRQLRIAGLVAMSVGVALLFLLQA